jgi:hypothetical protein
MSHKRSLTTGFLIASLGLAAGLGVFASPTIASAGDDCADLKKPKVIAVCKNGFDGKKGKDAVEKAMKAAQKALKAATKESVKCTDCHVDQKQYKAKDNADADFDSKLDAHFPAPGK